MTHYVYTISDPRDGAVYYVGCTSNLKKRSREHRSGYLWVTKELEASLKREGLEVAITTIAETATKEEGLKLEKYWIGQYKEQGHLLENTVHHGRNPDFRKKVFEKLHEHWLRQKDQGLVRVTSL